MTFDLLSAHCCRHAFWISFCGWYSNGNAGALIGVDFQRNQDYWFRFHLIGLTIVTIKRKEV